MDFYILQQNMDIEGSASTTGVPEGLDPSKLIRGESLKENAFLTNPNELPILDLHPKSGDYRGAMIQGIVPLFHEDFIGVLEEYGNINAEYYPVQLRDTKTDKLELGYAIFNSLKRVKALDLEKSNYTEDAWGNPKWVKEFYINEDLVKDLSIFRLDSEPTLIIVREDMLDLFAEKSKAGMKLGIRCLRTDQYKKSMW